MVGERTILTIRAGGTLMVETGRYDTTSHKWVSSSAREATDADVPYKLSPSIISLHKDMTPTDVSPAVSGSHNTHARLSPSGSKCWSNCTAAPAFLEANSHRIPQDDGGIYANEGTEAHDWAAKVLLGETVIEEIPENFREPVGLYVDHCMALVPEGVSYQVEVQCDLYYQDGQKGTCDFAIVTDERVIIRDLKYGAGVLVHGHENTQLAIYCYSFIKMLEDVYDFTPETMIDMAPFQPRHREAEDMQPWVLTLGELEKFCRDIEYQAISANEAVNRVREKLPCGQRNIGAAEILEAAPGVKFVPQDGDDGSCRWCKGKSICETRLAAATEGMNLPNLSGAELIALLPDLSKGDLKEPTEVRVEIVADALMDGAAKPLMITDEYLVNIYARSKAIRRFLDDIEEHLEARALAGTSTPGTKLVHGREGNRAWSNEDEADTFLKGQKMKEAERYNFKLKSPTQIEVVLKDKLATSTRTQNRFNALVSRSPAKPVLALASDKRPAITAAVNLLPDLAGINDDEV